MQGLKDELFDLLQAKGARLMGVADLRGVVSGELTTGVSVAVPVPKEIVWDLQTAPTLAYYEAYHSLNAQLNQIVSAGVALLQERGFHAVANTTDTVKTDENWRSPLPHKTVAVYAGLGWIGKNCLLITERYGGAVRLSSLLTDAPLPFDAPVEKSRCGGCSACVERCPAKAFTGATWTPGIEREKLFDWKRCYPEQLRRMKQATGIETDLCGLCFAVCPYTQRYLREE